MKILFAIKSLNVVGGGAENVLVEVANGLQSRNHEVGILTFDDPGQGFYDLDKTIPRLDMAFNQPGQPTSPKQFLSAIPRIRKAVREFRPDVFVPFMHSTFVPLAFATIGMKLRTVFSEHVDYAHYIKNERQHSLLRLAKRSCLSTTIPSPAAMLTYPETEQRKMQVIPNPIHLTSLDRDISRPSLEQPMALSVGRLMEEKDHAVLIEAFSSLADEFPDWTLKIVGEGNLRGPLEALVKSLGLEERIQLPGATRDVTEEYAKASFVVLPSRYESFGMVAAESLAASRPVLSFAECAGLSEMVEDNKNGILVKGGSDHDTRKSALAAGLQQLMSDHQLRARLGSAGPESVTRYNIESVLNQWEAVLSESTR